MRISSRPLITRSGFAKSARLSPRRVKHSKSDTFESLVLAYRRCAEACHFRQGQIRAQAIVEYAKENFAADNPLWVVAHLAQSEVAFCLGDFQSARLAGTLAWRQAQKTLKVSDFDYFRAAKRQAILLDFNESFHRAMEMVRHAEASVQTLDVGPQPMFEFLAVKIKVQAHLLRFSEARATLEALQTWVDQHMASDPRVVVEMKLWQAYLTVKDSNLSKTERLMGEVMASWDKMGNPLCAAYASSLLLGAVVADGRGDYVSAYREGVKSLRITQTIFCDEYPAHALLYEFLAVQTAKRKDKPETLAYSKQCLTLVGQVFGKRSRHYLRALSQFAMIFESNDWMDLAKFFNDQFTALRDSGLRRGR